MKDSLNKLRFWAEMNLDHLVFNYQQTQNKVPSFQLICVVKADAYGHGVEIIAKELADAGAPYFGVTTVEEALQLRRQGITTPILILSMISAERVSEMADNDITVTVGDILAAREYAEALGEDKQLKIHIKINTGMNRIGLRPDVAVEQIIEISGYENFNVEGIFTHFAAAEDNNELDFTLKQIELFDTVIVGLTEQGIEIPLHHYSNSAAIINFSEVQYRSTRTNINMARPGAILYGVNPTDKEIELRPVMSLKARIMKIMTIREGESVSYNRTWYASRDSVIATIGFGYIDGLLRSFSNKLTVLINGQRASQVGRICMDQCMIDVTDIPSVNVGDIVTILGIDGDDEITFEDLSEEGSTIPVEIMNSLGIRIPRLYYRDGEVVDQRLYIDYL